MFIIKADPPTAETPLRSIEKNQKSYLKLL
jgi:hypothetical protein